MNSDTHPGIRGIAQQMLQSGKGILAADESTNSANKRFAEFGVPETEEAARQYRQLLFTTPDVEEYLSGVILFDGTIRQKSDDGVLFAELLAQKGIIPGIKVDQGLVPLEGSTEEQVTEGLEGLSDRLKEYYEMGARFAKWRAALKVTDELPSEEAIRENSRRLAQYALVCQQNNIVPMVEPEVLLDPDPEEEHDSLQTLERSAEVLRQTLVILFEELNREGVDLSGLILKTSMALPGKDSGVEQNAKDVAQATVEVLTSTVPQETAGIVFLSGGQSPLQASENLQKIIELGPHPWPMTFSYSRAIQEPVLRAWHNEDSQVAAARDIFLHRLRMNVAARDGTYTKEAEAQGPAHSS